MTKVFKFSFVVFSLLFSTTILSNTVTVTVTNCEDRSNGPLSSWIHCSDYNVLAAQPGDTIKIVCPAPSGTIRDWQFRGVVALDRNVASMFGPNWDANTWSSVTTNIPNKNNTYDAICDWKSFKAQ